MPKALSEKKDICLSVYVKALLSSGVRTWDFHSCRSLENLYFGINQRFGSDSWSQASV